MTRSSQTFARIMRATATTLLASVTLTSASVAGAQNVATRWQPWVGCWAPSGNTLEGSSGAIVGGSRDNNLLCVVPTSNPDAVDIVTVSNNTVVHRESVNATGMQLSQTRDNCPGWESASFSSDNHRLLLRSEFTCAGNTKIKGSGVFAISANGEFIQIQGTSVGANTNSRVVRYQPANLQIASSASLNDSAIVRTVPLQGGFASSSMRVAAGSPVGANAIAEVTKNVDGPVAIAWVNEIDQRFNVDGKELTALADAGVSSDVIDMMVALSYPDKFAVRRTDGGVPVGGAALPQTDIRTRRDNYGDRDWDCGYGNRMMPFGYYGDGCFSRYGYGYGVGGYGYGIGGYGYNGYYGGYGPYNYYYGSSPVVIVTRGGSNDAPDARGHAVKGGGYRRDDRGGSSSTAPKADKGSSSSGSSSSGSSSAGSSSGSSSSGSTTRTAKPRPPGK